MSDELPKKKAGRPKGSKNSWGLRLAREAAAEGISPLEMMMKSMVEFDQRADELKTLIQSAVQVGDVEVANQLLGRWFACRKEASDTAAKAAPYIHAKPAPLPPETGDHVPLEQQVPQLFITMSKGSAA